MNSENFAEKFQSALPVALEIRQNFAHVEMPFRAETAGIQQQVARDRDARNRAANIDVWKIKRLAVERDETLRPDLTDIGPEVGQQFAFVRLAVRSRAVQFKPVDTNADDPAGAWV